MMPGATQKNAETRAPTVVLRDEQSAPCCLPAAVLCLWRLGLCFASPTVSTTQRRLHFVLSHFHPRLSPPCQRFTLALLPHAHIHHLPEMEGTQGQFAMLFTTFPNLRLFSPLLDVVLAVVGSRSTRSTASKGPAIRCIGTHVFCFRAGWRGSGCKAGKAHRVQLRR